MAPSPPAHRLCVFAHSVLTPLQLSQLDSVTSLGLDTEASVSFIFTSVFSCLLSLESIETHFLFSLCPPKYTIPGEPGPML